MPGREFNKQANFADQQSQVPATFSEKLADKISYLFFQFTIPSLLIMFALGIAGIASYVNHQQVQLINSFAAQEEALYQMVISSELSHDNTQKVRSLLTKNIFNDTQERLQETFLILTASLSIYLVITIFVIRKLKSNSKQLRSYVQQLQGMNDELYKEISKRDEMSYRLEELNGELKYQSLHDTLTKLPNRRLFEDRLNFTVQASQRNKLVFAVMFLDLDGFKLINDTLGHDVGDELLKAVSAIFTKAVRSMDTVARLGGDEFAFILTDLDKPESASYVAERIIKNLEPPIYAMGQELNVNATIGITLYPHDGNSGKVLLKNADIAMYHAKSLGRGNFQFYREEMNALGKRDLLLRNSFNNALSNAELYLQYQPIIDTQQHAIIHFEALLRWHHPLLGDISPMEIIRLANNLGLHISLGEWILNEVCRQLKAWEEAKFIVPSVCINISSVQLESQGYVNKFKKILDSHTVDPKAIILEVTESTLVQNTTHIAKVFSEFNEMGVKIAFDDFGTGYSALNYLRKLPVQIIKIDQSFIKDMQDQNSAVAIIRAIIALAQALNLEVIAEGVENQEQMQALNSLGCHKMQGYLFSRPLTAADCFHLTITSKTNHD